MTTAAVETLRFHLDRMLEHEEGTRLGEDPEELHDTVRLLCMCMAMSRYLCISFIGSSPPVLWPQCLAASWGHSVCAILMSLCHTVSI